MKKFGVEIECLLNDVKDIQNIIELTYNRGLSIKNEFYNHNIQEYWKIVSDISIKDPNKIGKEFVSPILFGNDGRRQIKTISQILFNNKATTNQTCGLHVHIDAHNMDIEKIKKVIYIYYKHEKEIDKLIIPSRRANNYNYCQSLNSIIDVIDSYDEIDKIIDEIPTRNLKVNISSIQRHNTIEFRQHHGTIDYNDIIHWVDLCQGIITWAESNLNCDYKLFDGLCLNDDEVKYWINEIKKYE